jgi:EAL and modified HD-GYP domain-containing signal transduction protein
VFVARQPIFDASDRLFAYELLYRSGTQQNFADGLSPDQMCTDTVIHALLSIGLAPLTGGTLAFVNMTRDFLMRGLYELFDPKTVVIELLETVEPDEEVVAACRKLARAGYTLALDDFVNAPGYEPLLAMARIIKIDVLGQSEAELARVAKELAPCGARLLAERVETAEVRDMCRRLGFTLFQGYFYSKPQIVSHRELSVEHTTMLRLMALLDDAEASDTEIEDAFRSDPSLSYKLLRIANSAAFGGRDVQSIGFALRMVGRKVLHRWLSLLLVSSVASTNGIAGELVLAALVRARLCELVAQRGKRAGDMGPLFLVGLFSLLDALLRMPMEGILARMAISADVKDALLSRSGPYAPTLSLVEAQERGDWQAVVDATKALGLTPGDVSQAYAEALGWAAERATL